MPVRGGPPDKNYINPSEKVLTDLSGQKKRSSDLRDQIEASRALEEAQKSLEDIAAWRQGREEKGAEYWKQVEEQIEHTKKAGGAKAYEEFNTSIQDHIQLIVLFFRAMRKERTGMVLLSQLLDAEPIPRVPISLRMVLKQGVWENLKKLSSKGFEKLGIEDTVTALQEKAGLKEAIEIGYQVGLDDENKIRTVASIKGKALPPQFQQQFDAGFVMWANDCGYDYNSQDQTLINKITKQPISKLEFDRLLQDESGLAAFFREHCAGIQVTPMNPKDFLSHGNAANP